MYEHFTDGARKVMKMANMEAQRYHHFYIGPEHILLALVQEGSGLAAQVLRSLEVDPDRIRNEVEKLPVEVGETVMSNPVPRAKKVIEYAITEARELNHVYIGTEHILLGLMREAESGPAQILLKQGLSPSNVRDAVLQMLSQRTETPAQVIIPALLARFPAHIVQAMSHLDGLIQFFRDMQEDVIARARF